MPSLPVCKTPLDAAKALLDQLLAAPAESALVKALGEPGDDKTKEFLRDVASKAAVAMIKGPGADKAPELLKAFEAVLDDPPKNKKGGTVGSSSAEFALPRTWCLSAHCKCLTITVPLAHPKARKFVSCG